MNIRLDFRAAAFPRERFVSVLHGGCRPVRTAWYRQKGIFIPY